MRISIHGNNHGLRALALEDFHVHEAEATDPAGEESDELAGEEDGGKRGGLLSPGGGSDKAVDCTLHWGEMEARVRGKVAHLVGGLGGDCIGCWTRNEGTTRCTRASRRYQGTS